MELQLVFTHLFLKLVCILFMYFFNIAAFYVFFYFLYFFCHFLLFFFKYCPSMKALLQSVGVCSYTSQVTTTITVLDKAGLLWLLRRPALPVC